jgi:hypothetical protein
MEAIVTTQVNRIQLQTAPEKSRALELVNAYRGRPRNKFERTPDGSVLIHRHNSESERRRVEDWIRDPTCPHPLR